MDLGEALTKSVDLLEAGKPDECLAIVDHVLKTRSDLAVAHQIRGQALLSLNRVDEAVPSLREACRLHPQSGQVKATLGIALQAQAKAKEAYESFIQALSLEPDNPNVQIPAAHFLLEQGEYAEAERFFELAGSKGDMRGVHGLAVTWERKGEVDRASELLGKHRDQIQGSLPLSLAFSRLLRRAKDWNGAVEILKSIQPEGLDPDGRVNYFHELGEAYDGCGNADMAFEAFAEANRLRNIQYRADDEESRVSGIVGHYPKEAFAKLPKASNTSVTPVFIVGVPRSGTSLLEQILSSHPGVFGAGELDDIHQLSKTVNPESQDDLNAASRQYLAKIDALGKGVDRVTDKMPHNFYHLGLIAQLFPQSRIICCTRDPLDTGLSCFRQNFRATHTYATDLGSIGHFIVQHQKLMAHWRKVLPLPILDLRYEDLVAHAEGIVKKVLEFLGLPWDPAVLDFHQSDRLTKTASYHQVRQPLHNRFVGRSAPYWKHLKPLVRALGMDG